MIILAILVTEKNTYIPPKLYKIVQVTGSTMKKKRSHKGSWKRRRNFGKGS